MSFSLSDIGTRFARSLLRDIQEPTQNDSGFNSLHILSTKSTFDNRRPIPSSTFQNIFIGGQSSVDLHDKDRTNIGIVYHIEHGKNTISNNQPPPESSHCTWTTTNSTYGSVLSVNPNVGSVVRVAPVESPVVAMLKEVAGFSLPVVASFVVEEICADIPDDQDEDDQDGFYYDKIDRAGNPEASPEANNDVVPIKLKKTTTGNQDVTMKNADSTGELSSKNIYQRSQFLFKKNINHDEMPSRCQLRDTHWSYKNSKSRGVNTQYFQGQCTEWCPGTGECLTHDNVLSKEVLRIQQKVALKRSNKEKKLVVDFKAYQIEKKNEEAKRLELYENLLLEHVQGKTEKQIFKSNNNRKAIVILISVLAALKQDGTPSTFFSIYNRLHITKYSKERNNSKKWTVNFLFWILSNLDLHPKSKYHVSYNKQEQTWDKKDSPPVVTSTQRMAAFHKDCKDGSAKRQQNIKNNVVFLFSREWEISNISKTGASIGKTYVCKKLVKQTKNYLDERDFIALIKEPRSGGSAVPGGYTFCTTCKSGFGDCTINKCHQQKICLGCNKIGDFTRNGPYGILKSYVFNTGNTEELRKQSLRNKGVIYVYTKDYQKWSTGSNGSKLNYDYG